MKSKEQNAPEKASEHGDEIDLMSNYNLLEGRLSDTLRDLQDIYFNIRFIEEAGNEKFLNTNRKNMLHCIKMVSGALLSVVERKAQLKE